MAPRSSLRSSVKAVVEAALASRPLALLSRRLRAGARLTLAYHNVVVGTEDRVVGDNSLHLRFDRLLEHLDTLRDRGLGVCPLGATRDVGERVAEVSISFDDACAGALRHAVPALAARGIPVTVFVAPGLLGCAAPWWDRLADPALGEIPASIRERALGEFKGRHAVVMGAAERFGWPIQPPNPACRIATLDELDAALEAHPGLMVGAHSWDHPNLAALDGVELTRELVRPLAWLRARWPERTVPWLAYPYGLESPAVRLAVREAGYVGALLVRGGWQRSLADPFGTPRLNVSSGLSSNGFRARLSGWISS